MSPWYECVSLFHVEMLILLILIPMFTLGLNGAGKQKIRRRSLNKYVNAWISKPRNCLESKYIITSSGRCFRPGPSKIPWLSLHTGGTVGYRTQLKTYYTLKIRWIQCINLVSPGVIRHLGTQLTGIQVRSWSHGYAIRLHVGCKS